MILASAVLQVVSLTTVRQILLDNVSECIGFKMSILGIA
jgi:hypothetical protein